MTTLAFDTLGYFEKLKAAGVPDAQAKVQVEAMQDIVKAYDESSRKELATKGDIQDIHAEFQKVRNEIQDVKHEILKWMMGMLVAQSALILAVISYLK